MKYRHSFYLSLILLGTAILFNPTKIYSAMDHIVINEVQIAGISASDDFVELYNPTDIDVNLGDYRLVKRTASGTTDSSLKAFDVSDTIPAHGYYLWSNNGWDPGVIPDSSTSATIAANNGVALRLGAADTGDIVDSVAWGTATNAFIEGSVFPTSPDASQSLVRSGDTDDNSVDFTISDSPSPMNSNTVIITPTPTATASPTVSPSASPTATPSPTISPTSTPTVTPSPTSSPTPSPTVSPTPHGRVLGIFRNKVCSLEYKEINIWFMKIVVPKVVCTHPGN